MNINVYKLSEDMAEDYISYFDNRAFQMEILKKAVIAFYNVGTSEVHRCRCGIR